MYIILTDTPRPQSRMANCYLLHMSFMHGDGDHYTTETIHARLDNPAELEHLHKMMECCDMVSLLDSSYLERRIQYGQAQRDGRLGDVDKDTVEHFVDCVPYDLTNEQFLAAFDRWEVRYFDEHGVEYSTKITKVEV